MFKFKKLIDIKKMETPLKKLPLEMENLILGYLESDLNSEALSFTPGLTHHTSRFSCICLRQQLGALHVHGPHCGNGEASWFCETNSGGFDSNSNGHSHYCYLNNTFCKECKYSREMCLCDR